MPEIPGGLLRQGTALVDRGRARSDQDTGGPVRALVSISFHPLNGKKSHGLAQTRRCIQVKRHKQSGCALYFPLRGGKWENFPAPLL